jgi:hypothetical protein
MVEAEVVDVQAIALGEGFDYGTLAPETRVFVQAQTLEIKMLWRGCWVELAQRFAAVKERLEHGQFLAWIASDIEPELGIGERTVHRMMKAVHSLKSDNLSDLPIQKSAAYELSGAPEKVKEEAISRAEAGETITRAKAKAMIAEFQPQQEVIIADEASPDFGQQAFVVEAVGDIIQCETTDGVKPFLRAELAIPDQPAKPVKPASKPAQPSNPLGAMQATLDVAAERELYLTELLQRVLAECRSHLSAALLAEIEGAIL